MLNAKTVIWKSRTSKSRISVQVFHYFMAINVKMKLRLQINKYGPFRKKTKMKRTHMYTKHARITCWVCVIFFPRLVPRAVRCVGHNRGVTGGAAAPLSGSEEAPRRKFFGMRSHSYADPPMFCA